MKLTNKEFIKIIEKKYTFEKNPLVAVAVSGGPDSMSLLFLVNAFINSLASLEENTPYTEIILISLIIPVFEIV